MIAAHVCIQYCIIDKKSSMTPRVVWDCSVTTIVESFIPISIINDNSYE